MYLLEPDLFNTINFVSSGVHTISRQLISLPNCFFHFMLNTDIVLSGFLLFCIVPWCHWGGSLFSACPSVPLCHGGGSLFSPVPWCHGGGILFSTCPVSWCHGGDILYLACPPVPWCHGEGILFSACPSVLWCRGGGILFLACPLVPEVCIHNSSYILAGNS